MNSRNDKISNPHRLLLNLTDKIHLYQILASTIHEKS